MAAKGDESCNDLFRELTGRSFTDPMFGGVHGTMVDSYALQHPDRYCVSAKSLAAHLCGLCLQIERGGGTALPEPALQRWLNGQPALTKPVIPSSRGSRRVADLLEIGDPADFKDSVRAWGESVWAAYRELQPIARQWLDLGLSAPDPRRRHHH